MKFITTTAVAIILCILALVKAQDTLEYDFDYSDENYLEKDDIAKEIETKTEAPNFNTTNLAVVKSKWITQNLNNFDKQSQTWNMRYLVNDNFLKKGGPIFIYVGGNNAVEPENIQRGIIYDLAREHHAILFQTEHRYYGESKPTCTLSDKNFKYLNANQTLADLAHFIETQKRNDERLRKSKVIIFGCSYGGSLAVWFSKFYPDLVKGVFASGAPVLAKADFKEYNEVVGKAYQTLGSKKCYNRIKNGIREMQEIFASKITPNAKAQLKLCKGFDYTNEFDLANLFKFISTTFANVVENTNNSKSEISKVCKLLMSKKNDLAGVITFFANENSHNNSCIEASYRKSLKVYKGLNKRAWLYQTCNEFGWYATSNSDQQPFGSKFPLEFLIKLCRDVFGGKYTKRSIRKSVAKTNKLFGGTDSYPKTKNIYVTYGAQDPWTPVGYTKSGGATIIPKATRCADFAFMSFSDSPKLRESKKHLIGLIQKWLA